MASIPSNVTIRATFLSRTDYNEAHSGYFGRSNLHPNFANSGTYRPHLVIQSPDVRAAEYLPDSTVGAESYLGVTFVKGPDNYQMDRCAEFVVQIGFVGVDYSKLVIGETFTIREGGNIVGYGKVQEIQPEAALQIAARQSGRRALIAT